MTADERAELATIVERAVERALHGRRGAFSPEEAADWLGVSPATVRRMLADGRLPFVRLGGPNGKRRIARSALERFVDPGLEVAS